MPETQAFPLRTKSGRKGQVFRRARFLDRGGVSRVQLEDGTEMSVPAASLTVEPDGSFLLDDGGAKSAAAQAPAVVEAAPSVPEPVAELALEVPQPEVPIAPPHETAVPEPVPAVEAEPVVAAKQVPETPPVILRNVIVIKEEEVVRPMATSWQTEEAVNVSDPLFTEDVQVERVTVNRMLDAPVEVRQEGDTTIIPMIEEVVIVQKRLMLREEVRITRRRVEIRESRKVNLKGPQPRTYGADGREIENIS